MVSYGFQLTPVKELPTGRWWSDNLSSSVADWCWSSVAVRCSAVREGVSDGRQDLRREAEDVDGTSNSWSTLPAAALLHDAVQRQNTSGWYLPAAL